MFWFGLNYSLISKNEMSASSMNGRYVMPWSLLHYVYRKKYKAMITEAELLKQQYQIIMMQPQIHFKQNIISLFSFIRMRSEE